MTSHQLDEERIFHLAREIHEEPLRAEYLEQICAGDRGLRERVEALLEVHEKEQLFLKSAPDDRPTDDYSPNIESPGDQIGRYKLLQKIGEGGFGVVFLAEQARPVRRKVALKVIKPGMDTGAVIARFEAERQALALMDHPNIARVLDGGATNHGRPYFVMELVNGGPITEHCDKNYLPTRNRLGLFITVCHAVQHAHQKGIIHRDLKPSNILITLADGNPVVKVIDFGVSKAVNQQLTEKTLFTAFGQMVGTPQYMSPEQAEMSCLDVDTRSDIYSLGVLLYELLTGTTPLEGERLRTAGYAEMQRIIREEEPPKPSVRLSTAGETRTAIAKHRSATPDRLHNMVRGDLDWIAMKALEKDRIRRYETASSFAVDVERFLNDEPLEARPPSTSYRFYKFIRRNKRPVAAVSMLLIALVAGVCGTTSGWVRANMAHQDTTRALVRLEDERQKYRNTLERLQAQLVENALAEAVSGQMNAAAAAIEDARLAGVPATRLRMLRGLAALYAGQNDEAIAELQQVVDDQPDSAAAWALLALVYRLSDELDRYTYALVSLEKIDPDSDDDYGALFRGFAQTFDHLDVGVQTMRRVVDAHPTWAVARVMLAGGLARNAVEYSDVHLCEEAIGHIAWAKAALAENPFLLAVQLHALSVAIVLGDEQGQDTARWQDEAKIVSNDLARRFGDYVPGRIVRAQYFMCLQDYEQAEREWELALELGAGQLTESVYLGLLLSQQKIDKAVAVSEQKAHAQLFAANRADVLRACDAADATGSLLFRIWTQQARFLCGQREEANRRWNELLNSTEPKRRWARNPLRLLTGQATPAELLEEAGSSNWWKAHSHFLIAAKYLNEGDRESAKSHFQQCVNANQFTRDIHYWAKAYLVRMNDESWPDCLRTYGQ